MGLRIAAKGCSLRHRCPPCRTTAPVNRCMLYGVIYPPQVAIVGIAKPRLMPWVENGEITPRSITHLTLAADHRVSDGYRGALFLRKIDSYLQTPEKL